MSTHADDASPPVSPASDHPPVRELLLDGETPQALPETARRRRRRRPPSAGTVQDRPPQVPPEVQDCPPEVPAGGAAEDSPPQAPPEPAAGGSSCGGCSGGVAAPWRAT